MEQILSTHITVSMIVGVMIKILIGLLTVMAVVMTRQVALMDRVVKLPVGGSIKALVWSVLILMVLLTAIVVLA